MIGVKGLQELAVRLAGLDLAATEGSALAHAAIALQDSVRRHLSHTRGEAHASPWLRSGALRDSITAEVAGNEMVVGSADPVAADQECGTRTDPPRPFLAPAAAAEADGLVAGIAVAVSDRLRAVLR